MYIYTYVHGSFSWVGSKGNMMLRVNQIVYACMPYDPGGPNGPLQGPILGPHTPEGSDGPAPMGPCPRAPHASGL